MCSCFSHFSSLNHHLHSYILVTFTRNTCIRLALLLVLSLILPISLGQYIPMAPMALLRNTLLDVIQMSRATIFLMAHGRWVLFHSYSISFLFLHPSTCSYNHSFKIQAIVQELVWLARNLKLELTEYSLQLYSGEDADGDNDDDGGKGSESRLQAISQGRGTTSDPTDK